MSIKKNNEDLTTDLIFPTYFSENEAKKYYLIEQHKHLPTMQKNQLQLSGIDLTINTNQQINVIAFIRSTIEKPIRLKKSVVFLLNQESEIVAQSKVDFTKLGILKPNTSVPWEFVFSGNNLFPAILNGNESWTLSFKEKSKHRLDFSDLNGKTISQDAKKQLEEIIHHSSLAANELSLIGLSAKLNIMKDLEVTLLIQNGTMTDLEIKQLPLKFYDATEELVAHGTFQLANFTIYANTSKPMLLVFPKTSILKENIDLTRWIIEHVK